MNRPLIIGLMTEGPTDVRFLNSIVTRSFEELMLQEGNVLPDIYDLEILSPSGNTFAEKVANAAAEAHKTGVMILCIHADADDRNDSMVFRTKISPAESTVVGQANGDVCKLLVPVVPVQMTEAWMLADVDLLVNEMMTEKSVSLLGLSRPPEAYANPKSAIMDAIRISQHDIAKRRKRYELSIQDLYQPIGQKISLAQLSLLPSYRKFRSKAREALIDLNYIRKQ